MWKKWVLGFIGFVIVVLVSVFVRVPPTTAPPCTGPPSDPRPVLEICRNPTVLQRRSLDSIAKSLSIINSPKHCEAFYDELRKKKGLRYSVFGSLDPLKTITQLETLSVTHIQTCDFSMLAEMKSLEGLEINNSPFYDLTPISKLTNLTQLTLSGVFLKDVTPISKLTELTELDLHNNLIDDIEPLSGLTELVTLDLSNNSLGPLTLSDEPRETSRLSPLKQMTLLFSLKLNNLNGDLEVLPDLQGLIYLTVFEAQYNKIKDLSPLAQNTSLRQLSLRGNQIVDISPLAKLTELRYLYLDHNQIVDLSPLAGLSLRTLHLDDNQINSLQVVHRRQNIPVLSTKNNPVKDITPPEISKETIVREATTTGEASNQQPSGGKLEIDSPLPKAEVLAKEQRAKARSKAKYLAQVNPGFGAAVGPAKQATGRPACVGPKSDPRPVLEICRNPTELQRDSLGWLAIAAGTTYHPEKCELLYTTLRQTPHLSLYTRQSLDTIKTLTNLETLKVTLANTCDFSMLAEMKSLVELNISYSRFYDLSPLSKLGQLRRLSITQGHVADLSPLSGLAGLTELDLHDNKIRDISDIEPLQGLVSLDIHQNQVDNIAPLAAFVELETLDLSHNPLVNKTGWDHSNNQHPLGIIKKLVLLKSLKLNSIGEKELDELPNLKNLRQLERLEADDNAVSDLSLLSQNITLKRLSLSHNKIFDLSPLAALTDLEEVHLSGNAIESIEAARHWRGLRVIQFEGNQVKDVSPLSGMPVLTEMKAYNNPIKEIMSLSTSPHLWDISVDSRLRGEQSDLNELYEKRIADDPSHRDPGFKTKDELACSII